MIGEQAGICWGANTANLGKNYNRGLDCLRNNHGRTFEFPDVYMILDGYSARVIREWYTHIGGSPTRLQESTRYIEYGNFDFIVPPSIKDSSLKKVYTDTMTSIKNGMKALEISKVPREDIALLLPLGMKTKIVCKHNLRNLMDMSRQRMCNRAYWEYRELFKDLQQALTEYSEEWAYLIKNFFYAKCEPNHICTETHGCGKYPRKG